jgi:hypothetical protein
MSSGSQFETMRRLRGWLLAHDTARVVLANPAGGPLMYRVPSETRPGIGYDVFVDEDGVFVCTCPDFGSRHKPCKHVIEILYRFHSDIAPSIPTPEEIGSLGPVEMYSGARRFARQPLLFSNGPAESTRRDHALAVEGKRIEELGADLAAVLNARYPQRGAHRHSLPAGDRVFVFVLRDYHQKSLRAISDILDSVSQAGLIDFAPCKNSMIAYLKDAVMLHYLQEAFAITRVPFQEMEQDVLVDSTGMSPFYFESHRAVAYGDHKSPQAKWFRIHVAIGRRSKAVLGFSLTPSVGRGTGDITQLSSLLDGVEAAGFRLRNVIADKAYLDLEHILDVEKRGARLIAPLKARNRYRNGRVKPEFLAIQAFAERHPEEYDELTRARQAIEGIFSLEKRHSNRFISIGSAEERKMLAAGEHSGLYRSRINEFFVRMIRYNLTRINVEEHIRDRQVLFSNGGFFNHIREGVGSNDVA